ncbi:unnamed protein product [Lampetra fluviatilis]
MTYKKLFDPIGSIGKKTHPRLVIVVGIPGSGKTMLSKFIVHSLLSGERRFFCGLASSTPWKFFEGILDPPSADSQKEIIEWLNRRMETQKFNRLLSLLHCVHELDDSKSLSDATRSMTKINLPCMRLSLPDCTVISWVLLHREEPVERLNLSGCGIGTEEMKRLQPGLHRCKELCLNHNEIGDSGLRLLADVMLGREGSLEMLALQGCSLTDKSIPALHDIMITNKALRELLVYDNGFSKEGKQELRSKWSHRGGLHIFV